MRHYVSCIRNVPLGASQGSVLDLLLFSAFVNNVCDAFVSGYCWFADDLKLFKIIRNTDKMHYLQTDLNYLSVWYRMF
jgi:hypothetical protein